MSTPPRLTALTMMATMMTMMMTMMMGPAPQAQS
jgi:hypothetical protein